MDLSHDRINTPSIYVFFCFYNVPAYNAIYSLLLYDLSTHPPSFIITPATDYPHKWKEISTADKSRKLPVTPVDIKVNRIHRGEDATEHTQGHKLGRYPTSSLLRVGEFLLKEQFILHKYEYG